MLNVLSDVPMRDEIVEHLRSFIKRHISNPFLEIEGKIGLLKSSFSKNRVAHMDVCNTVIVSPSSDNFFDSEIPYSVYISLLNQLQTRQKNSKVIKKTERVFETDRFYVQTDGNVRVSLDQDMKEVRKVRKTRLENVEFFCPLNQFDFRLSASMEAPVMTDLSNMKYNYARSKNRHSFFFDMFRVDMTEVTQTTLSSDEQQKSYEVEIEFVNLNFLKEECAKMDANKPNQVGTVIRCFLENMRSFVRAASPESIPVPPKLPTQQIDFVVPEVDMLKRSTESSANYLLQSVVSSANKHAYKPISSIARAVPPKDPVISRNSAPADSISPFEIPKSVVPKAVVPEALISKSAPVKKYSKRKSPDNDTLINKLPRAQRNTRLPSRLVEDAGSDIEEDVGVAKEMEDFIENESDESAGDDEEEYQD